MFKGLRFAFVLVSALGLLAWGASVFVDNTTHAWFQHDLALRSRLAINGARQLLIERAKSGNKSGVRALLVDLTRDERVMAAALCANDLATVATTPGFPPEFACEAIGAKLRAAAGGDGAQEWSGVVNLPGGSVHVAAVPIEDGTAAAGFGILIHDMSYIERREAAARKSVFVAFGVLALCAAAITIIAARLSWRGFRDEFARLLSGKSEAPEFRPFARDLRELVQQVAHEKDLDGQGASWSAERLRHVLQRHLHGEKVVVLANREPYVHQRGLDGDVTVLHPASGLVTALEPVMEACSGVWVAHGSGSADRETADERGRVSVPPGEDKYVVRRVWLTAEEEKGYYYGLANEGLWPLCHLAHARPIFRSEDWQYYKTVNEKFARAVCEETTSDDPIILVQDYHFALAPRLIRERLPHATIITFWHIPWPNSERIAICPWREELIEGMLGSSILGFHTQSHCNNFVDGVDRFLEARIDRERSAIVQHRRSTLVRPYPISIEWPSRWMKDVAPIEQCRASVFAELGLHADTLLGVGVDRLDYTKGIEERFLAVERLLERRPALLGRFVFAQLGAPSRTGIDRYRELNENLERLALRINERFGSASYRPIVLKRAHHEPPDVFRYFRAADLCYVSSLHDGMNLVAKEFVAARDDERGVLVLSHFTGAARELSEALLVNPYDLEEASDAMAAALDMPLDEQQERMRAMRALVSEFNIYRWAGRMLVDAARLRRQERMHGRWAENAWRVATGRS